MFDLCSIGDVMIDHFFFMEDGSVQEQHDGSSSYLRMPFGAKLPVTEYIHTTAGNCANVAVGSARLGLKTSLVSIIGEDSGGREIVHKMKKEGVSTLALKLERKERTNVSAVVSVGGERTILVYHAKRNYNHVTIPPAQAYYLTSAGPLGKPLEDLHRAMLKTLHKNRNAWMGFNPGTYQLQMGVAALQPIFAKTTILFVNKEEAEAILGVDPLPIEQLVIGLRKLGPQQIVVTDAGRGAWALTDHHLLHQPIFPAKVVERTGAGDSFACGVMCALVRGKPIEEALRWGAANAASVVGAIGPQAGLLKHAQLLARLKRARTIRTTVVEELGHSPSAAKQPHKR